MEDKIIISKLEST